MTWSEDHTKRAQDTRGEERRGWLVERIDYTRADVE